MLFKFLRLMILEFIGIGCYTSQFFMIIVTFIVGIALFYSDIVIDSVPLLKRLFSEKLRISSDGRWIRMYTVLSNINSYPLGDMPFTYAHNFFL